jgi:hypothetical protein
MLANTLATVNIERSNISDRNEHLHLLLHTLYQSILPNTRRSPQLGPTYKGMSLF